MKKRTIGMIVGSTALISTGTAIAIKSAKKKTNTESNANLSVVEKRKSRADEAIQRVKTTMDNQEETVGQEKDALDKAKADSRMQQNNGGEAHELSNPNAHHGDVSPEDVKRKDEMPSPDADEVEAEQGLDMLDHQHRSDWQANVFPATEEEAEAIEEAERGKTGKTQSEQARELEKQNKNRSKKQTGSQNRNRNRSQVRNKKQTKN